MYDAESVKYLQNKTATNPRLLCGNAFYRKSLTLGIVQASLTLLSLTRAFQRCSFVSYVLSHRFVVTFDFVTLRLSLHR